MSNDCTVDATLPPIGGAAIVTTGNAVMVAATLPNISGSATVLTGEGVFVSGTLPPVVGTVRVVGNSQSGALNANFPQISAPFVDPKTGLINPAWQQLLVSLWTRTGGANGTLTPYT